MRLFKIFIQYVLGLTFPIIVMINAYIFLVTLEPNFNFLNIDIAYHVSHCENPSIVFPDYHGYGGTSYFGFTSLKNMLEDFNTENTYGIIRALTKSFMSANWVFGESMPDMSAVGDENIINFLKSIYYVAAYFFQPIYAAGWLLVAVGRFAVEIYNFLSIFARAMGGFYNTCHINYYPQDLSDIVYTMSLHFRV